MFTFYKILDRRRWEKLSITAEQIHVRYMYNSHFVVLFKPIFIFHTYSELKILCEFVFFLNAAFFKV